jgi:DNA-binding LytR/AlgR family response regulator
VEAVNLLPSGKFVRVHRSFMVATNKIDKVERHQVSIGKVKIPVSEGYVQDVMNAVGR